MRVAVLASGRWAAFRGSLHSTAVALGAAGHDVLLVDPPVSPLSVVRHPERRRDLIARRREEVAPRVHLWRPLVAPGQSSSIGQRLNAPLLARGIGAPDLTLTSALEARTVLRRLPGRRVYCCIDSFEDLPGVDGRATRRREDELARAADVVVACSLPLCEQLRGRGFDARHVAHGVDPAFLDAPTAPPPPEIAGRPRPYVVAVGTLNFRVDARLLAAALAATDGGTLLVVGGGSSSAAGLDPAAAAVLAAPDVVTTGHRSAEEVRTFLAAADVAVVPYAVTPFNRKSSPLKIREYLAAGLPVVSTPNGATDELAELVAVAEDPPAFEAGVRGALADRSDGAARRDAMRARTWREVAAELVALA